MSDHPEGCLRYVHPSCCDRQKSMDTREMSAMLFDMEPASQWLVTRIIHGALALG